MTGILSSGCKINEIYYLPSPCPEWHEEAILDFAMLIEMQKAGEIDIEDLEYMIGVQQRYCEAVKCSINDTYCIQ